MGKVPYQEEELKKWCEESDSYNEVLVKSGRTKASSNRETLKKYIKLYNIDISHFSHSSSPLKGEKKKQIIDGQKKCIQCGELKDPIEDFYWSNNKTRNICKNCVRENERKRYKEKQEQIINYKKSLVCKKCGENRYYLLDFHHRDPEQKDYSISEKTRVSLENLKEELKKCDPLCSNCHREFHYLFSHNLIQDYDSWLNNK